MPNGKPGDSIAHDILHHRLTVFGPAVDALVREIDARIEPATRGSFVTLIESWPWNADGTPQDLPRLTRELEALRDTLPPPRPRPRLEPIDPPPPRASRIPQRRGSPIAAIIGVCIGGAVGLPLGLLAWLVARETGVLPAVYWSSEKAMWAIVALVAGLCALIGLVQGARPTRLGHTLLMAMLGFSLGAVVLGLLGGVAVFVMGAMSGPPERGTAGTLGRVFSLVPFTAVAGGALFALWTAGRAWRDWRG